MAEASTTLIVDVQPGARHGDELLLAREGDQALHHAPGHVVVHVAMTPHPLFTRREDDLEVTFDITLLEAMSFFHLSDVKQSLMLDALLLHALVGFTRELVHLDGRTVKLNREDIVQPNTIWKIPGEGMPRRSNPGEFGSLLVHFNIEYPTELDSAAKAAICQLLSDRVEPPETEE